MEINFVQVIFQVVNFSVVLGGLTYLLYKPVQKILDDRSKEVEEGQKAAEAVIKEKDELDKLKEKMEQRVKEKSVELMEEVRVQAEEQKKEIIEKAKQDARKEIEKLEESWNEEKKRLIMQLRGEMVEAVINVSQKILSKKVDSKTDFKLVNDELDILLKAI